MSTAESSEPPVAGTLLCAAPPPNPTPQQIGLAWIDHIENGGNVPDSNTLINLLRALVPAPSRAGMDVRLIMEDTGSKFPHFIDTGNGRLSSGDAIWTQCKTRMTHIAVRLVDSNGDPLAGAAVQPGGLALRLTLHKMSGANAVAETLDDIDNPRPREGLFLGRASSEFEPVVWMVEARQEFRFQVMLLSSDIGGARMCVKVAPLDPQLALNPNLTAQSHSFISRARMPDDFSANNAKRNSAASQLLTMALTLADSHESSNKRQHCSPECTE